ncbi:MAG: Hint domain-containing protein [Pseudomonadota bacterium]
MPEGWSGAVIDGVSDLETFQNCYLGTCSVALDRSDTATVEIFDDAHDPVASFNVAGSAVVCFLAGTQIDTAEGPRPVEALLPGDPVVTRDRRLQPPRWVGARRPKAEPRTPFPALRPHGATRVLPAHPVLVDRRRAKALFGETGAPVAAHDLIDDARILWPLSPMSASSAMAIRWLPATASGPGAFIPPPRRFPRARPTRCSGYSQSLRPRQRHLSPGG